MHSTCMGAWIDRVGYNVIIFLHSLPLASVHGNEADLKKTRTKLTAKIRESVACTWMEVKEQTQSWHINPPHALPLQHLRVMSCPVSSSSSSSSLAAGPDRGHRHASMFVMQIYWVINKKKQKAAEKRAEVKAAKAALAADVINSDHVGINGDHRMLAP
eukprot:762596-Hanusia_phi.AAC.1